MAVIETWYEQDLRQPVKVQYLDGNVFSQDNNGNIVGVYVYDNGEPATLDGSVSGYIIRSDGATVPAYGALDGNKCYIVLPSSAYAVPGVISIVIKLAGASTVTTLCAVVATVYQSVTDSAVDPGTIIPSIQALINEINAAVASIPSDYSALNGIVEILQYLVNNGGYIINKNILEQGQWSYSTKAANTARGRTKFLIPVRAGMTVVYSNTTYDIFIGVLSTKAASEYVQNSGWVSGSGAYRINNDGYMTFIFRNHADTSATINPDSYNSVVEIQTQTGVNVANLITQTNAIANEFGLYALRYENKTVLNQSAGTFSGSDKALTTDVLTFGNEFLDIEIDAGYSGVVYFTSPTGSYISRVLSNGVHHFYAGGSMPVVFTLKKSDNSKILLSEAKHIKIRRIDPEIVSEIGSGIVSHPVAFDVSGSVSATYLYYYTSETEIATQPIKIPKSGLRIGYNPKYHSTDYISGGTVSFPLFRIIAVKATQNGLALQNDDSDILAVSQSVVKFGHSVYIPYIEDCYVIVVQSGGVSTSDAIYVSSGMVERSFCGVYNIFPTALGVEYDSETGKNFLNIFGRQSQTYSYSSLMYYGTVLRLRDVNKIVCDPKYTIMCEIYKINNDRTITRYGDIFGVWFGSAQSDSQISTSGLSVLDFSEYDFDGFALVAIQSKVEFIGTSDAYGYSIKRYTTGNLGGYEDVINSVCVEYKNGVNVGYVPGLPPVLEENIHKLCNWKVPEYPSGWYTEQDSTTPYFFPTQYDAVPSMYNGTFVANSMLMQVTAKSLLTCLKNPNGRMRKMQRVTGETLGRLGYGLTCTNFTSVIRGLWENITPWHWAHGDLLKFDRQPFDYHDLSNVRPGDVLVKHKLTPALGRATDSHVMTVESLVTVNGTIKALNVIEATIPYCRRATYIEEEYYNIEGNWLVETYSIDRLEDYHWICRIKPEYLKPIEETFEMHPDSTEVGSVMCDRGTDSIYGIHAQYIMLSVSDSSISNLLLYKDDIYVARINLDNAETENGLRVVNVAPYINGEGLYSIVTSYFSEDQERFFVKGDVLPIERVDTGTIANVTVRDFSGLLWCEVWYGTSETEELKAQRKSMTYVRDQFIYDDATGTGAIQIPLEIEGKTISAITRVYKTQYGTYWATSAGRVSSDFYYVD